MKKYMEPIIQMLFLVLSVVGSVIHLNAYVNPEAYRNLFLTNIINAAMVGLYLIFRVVLWRKNQLEPLQRGMLLIVVYSCLPVFSLIPMLFTRILSVICFLGAFILLVLKNKSSVRSVWVGREMKSGLRVAFSAPLLAFGAGFLARGINVVLMFFRGTAEFTELLVSISDIVICIIWIPVAIGLIRKTSFGMTNVLACYIQASLLFFGLILFLVINPYIFKTMMDLWAIVAVLIMGLFFFIPTAILVKLNIHPAAP